MQHKIGCSVSFTEQSYVLWVGKTFLKISSPTALGKNNWKGWLIYEFFSLSFKINYSGGN